MVIFQQESLYEIIDEVDELLQLHYTELTLNRDKIKLEPMWEKYAALEFAGAFVVYTARSNGRLIGDSAFLSTTIFTMPTSKQPSMMCCSFTRNSG